MSRFHKLFVALSFAILLIFSPLPAVAQKFTPPQLIELAQSPGPALRDATTATFDAKNLQEGTAWTGHGSDFFFATRAPSLPLLMIDDLPGPTMNQLSGTDLWYAAATIDQLGRLHSFYYTVNGAKFGGKLDVPAFTPFSYQRPGVPSGTLSEKITHVSKIYDGMKSEYWIYVPAQYKPDIPAAVMVFNDGGGYTDRNGYNRAITGLSSGGIAAFNAAWQMPDQFARVISWIGSFSSIQWKEDPSNPDGGQDYPEKILREPHRNIRVWLQDGSNDLDLRYGDWPLNNLRMANALHANEYDFHFSFGKGT